MEGIAILINAGILYTSFGLALYSLISLVKLTYNYFKTKDKSMVKSDLKKTAIIIAIALSLLYLIGFAGEFRKLDLSDEAAGQLLSADISQIESGDYYLEIANEQSDEECRVYVVKYSGDTSLYDSPFYYRQIERFFDHHLWYVDRCHIRIFLYAAKPYCRWQRHRIGYGNRKFHPPAGFCPVPDFKHCSAAHRLFVGRQGIWRKDHLLLDPDATNYGCL